MAKNRVMRVARLFSWVLLAVLLVDPSGVSAQEEEAVQLSVGDQATGFELTTFGGETISLEQFQGEEGKWVVLTFVRAHW